MHTPVAVGGRRRERQLLRERRVAAVPDEFQIGEDGQVSLAQIAEAGLVMYPQAQLPVLHAGILDALRKAGHEAHVAQEANRTDRKSTRLNSSHQIISYAVFCLKKKKTLSPA